MPLAVAARPGTSVSNVTIVGFFTTVSIFGPGSASVPRRYSSIVQPVQAPTRLPDRSSGFLAVEDVGTKKLVGVE